MPPQLTIRIILEKPPADVLFGLQEGSGSHFTTVQKQIAKANNLLFDCAITVKTGKDGAPDFAGPFVQGKPGERFIYLDIGTIAGQFNSPWTRRLKVPLRDITWQMITQATETSLPLQTTVPGTAKDGGPNCATVKPFAGWKVMA